MNSEKNSNLQSEQQPLLDHAEQLIWSLLDDQIDDEGVRRLEELMKENEEVRLRYLQCSQIHADLYSHYQARPPESAPAQSPVLGSLLGDLLASQGEPASLAD